MIASRAKRALIFLLFMLTSLSCSSSSAPDASSDNTLKPLGTGNRWIGRVSYFDSFTQPFAVFMDTLEIVDTLPIDGETWYVQTARGDSIRGPITQYFINRPDGLYIRGEFTHASRIIKYPSRFGDTVTKGLLVLEGRADSFTNAVQVQDSLDVPLHVPYGFVQNYNHYQWRAPDTLNSGGGPFGSFAYSQKLGLVNSYYIKEERIACVTVLSMRVWELVDAKVK